MQDGRIKPEMTTIGFVYTTKPDDSFDIVGGTSLSCPVVSGTIAQLYQRYKQLNNGNNPTAPLIKAIVCNSADDLGNSGPDYIYGFGKLNGLRAVEQIENNNFFINQIYQSQNNYDTISVPEGTSKLKVLLYWHDEPATENASVTLVNNLNLTVISPNNSVYYPWVLNPVDTGANAVRGIDSINNIEQITIDNPSSGNYIIRVNGFRISSGSQSYVISYIIEQPGINITYPNGTESLVPNQEEFIRWSAQGVNNNFTLQFSSNNGTNWSNIASDITSTQRYYQWTPNADQITSQGKLRVISGSYSDISDTSFTIIGIPQNLGMTLGDNQVSLSWDAVTQATGYDVLMLDTNSTEYEIVTNTTNTSATVSNLVSSAVGYWFTVRACKNNGKGERAIALTPQKPKTKPVLNSPANNTEGMREIGRASCGERV
mgnify:CR=1 FL=1